jgi:hypothetical protein
MEIAANEIALERALVVMVVGTRPELTPSDVQAYIMGHFGLPSGSFTVHVHHPEDFLVLFGDYDVPQQILDAPLPSSSVRLVFRRWRKECGAQWLPTDYRVRLGIQGVPAHLCSSCALLCMAPETESKASLKKFFVTVACLHTDLIPNEKVMWAPIPFDTRHSQPGFCYRVVIDILEVVVISPGAPLPPPGSDFYKSGGAAEGLCQPPSGLGGPRRLRLALPVGALPPHPSGVGLLPLVLAPGRHSRARPRLFGAPVDPPLPRRAPAPIWNGGYRASTRW